MATTENHAADCFVPPASPLPPRKNTTIDGSPVEPRFGLPYIPHDLIPNILTRLPPRSVGRFRSVCKDWLAAISNPDFLDVHLEAAKQRPSLLMAPTTSYKKYGFALLIGFYKYRVGGDESGLTHFKKLYGSINMRNSPVHCDGMVLMTAKAKLMTICNPATGELVPLPPASLGFLHDIVGFASRTGLGFDPLSKKYKVARFFYQSGHAGYGTVCKLEVLTLGTNVWRQTTDDPPYPIASRTPVHVQGSLYWILIGTTTLGYPKPPHAFLRFSLADEKFSLVQCPPSDYKPARFVQSERELCCTCFCEQKRELEVWSLGVGLENPEWTRRCTLVITLDLVVFDFNGWTWGWRSPKVVLHGRMLILIAEQTVYQYDMHTNRMEKIASDMQDMRHLNRRERIFNKNILHLISYAESLVRINEL